MTIAGLVLLSLALCALARWTRPSPRHGSARFASRRQCQPFRARGDRANRIRLGTYATASWRPTSSVLFAPGAESVLILGPTQSGKTSSLVVPALRAWNGPVVAASVKEDLVQATKRQRQQQGSCFVFNPLRTNQASNASFDPVRQCIDWQAARRIAHVMLTPTGRETPTADLEFWSQLSAKFLAPLFLAANLNQRGLSQAMKWVNHRSVHEPLQILSSRNQEEAQESLLAALDREERQMSSVYATVEAFLEPFSFSTQESGPTIDPGVLLSERGTLYLCAPAHEQATYRTVFSTLIGEVLASAFEFARRNGGRLKQPLLLVLDEAANIAPLQELDTVASICASHGITLLTCFQDLAQVRARYGERWATVVNNHRTRVLLSGIADPNVDDLMRSYFGEVAQHHGSFLQPHRNDVTLAKRLIEPFQLRELPKFRGIVVSGRTPPARLALQMQEGRSRGYALDAWLRWVT